MKVKNMSKQEAEQTIEILKKRIEFNNKLNKFVRKFCKEHNINSWHDFNGYHDEPTEDMKNAMNDILDNDSLGDTSWMSDSLKAKYRAETGAIFGQVYSSAVNTYVLNDLHDVEKYLATLNDISSTSEENDLFRVERDLENTRLNLYFDDIPSEEVRSVLKHRGFRYSYKFNCWTRQLTTNAESSLEQVKKDLNIQ